MITRLLEQHLTSLDPGAQQSRLAMMADGPANTKTREHTERAATAVQAMHGDSCSADWVDPDPMCSTSFGDDCIGPPAPPCSGENTLVDNCAATPKSCLPSLEMRSPTAAGGLLPTGEASTATKTTYNKTPLRLYATEETNSKESGTVSTPRIAVNRIFSDTARLKKCCRRGRVKATRAGGTNGSRAVDGGSRL